MIEPDDAPGRQANAVVDRTSPIQEPAAHGLPRPAPPATPSPRSPLFLPTRTSVTYVPDASKSAAQRGEKPSTESLITRARRAFIVMRLTGEEPSGSRSMNSQPWTSRHSRRGTCPFSARRRPARTGSTSSGNSPGISRPRPKAGWRRVRSSLLGASPVTRHSEAASWRMRAPTRGTVVGQLIDDHQRARAGRGHPDARRVDRQTVPRLATPKR